MHVPSLPLVSVVTPAYNEERNLSQCIESVLSQTYPNWDFTIVNNCSTDGTLAIAQKYAAMDRRIRIVTNNTLVPAVANFNIAVRQISSASKYCKMILADDWIFPECLERMVGTMEEHPSVGITGAYGLMDRWVLWTGLPYPSTFISGREISRQRLLGEPYVFGSQTSVLFRSDLVRSHDPFFNESAEHPDSEICLKLLTSCDFGFVHQVLTFSRERAGSLLTKSKQLNTLAANLLHELTTYGPFYLTPQEHTQRLEIVISEYYGFLARSVLQRRNKEFWDYHAVKLKEHGIVFSRARLARTLGKLALHSVLRRGRISRNKRDWGLHETSAAEACR